MAGGHRACREGEAWTNVSIDTVIQTQLGLPRYVIEPTRMSSEQLTSTWCHPVW